MSKLMVVVLGIIALTPASAAPQVSSGAPNSTRPNSPWEGGGGTGFGPTSGSGTSTAPASPGATTAPGVSGEPSASPSQIPDDLARYTTGPDCEKAGGVWVTAGNRCVRRR